VQKKKCLRGLLPEHGVIAAEAIEGAVVNIAQAKETTAQISSRCRKCASKRTASSVASAPSSCRRSNTRGDDPVLGPNAFSGSPGGPQSTPRRSRVISDWILSRSVSIEMILRSRQSSEASRNTAVDKIRFALESAGIDFLSENAGGEGVWIRRGHRRGKR
jgi:hypothetical protein